MRHAASLCILGIVGCSQALKIQTDGSWQGSVQIDPALQAVMPIEWVHIPKTGSGFLNTLIHLPGACPGLPENLYVSKETFGEQRINEQFMSQYKPTETCNASAVDLREGRILHTGIETYPDAGFDKAKGHYMIFMRQPEQRIISYLRYEPGIESVAQAIAVWHGQATKILTRSGAMGFNLEQPTAAEFEEAKQRLRTGFAFVGITEQWDLSLCLFNKMFNQPCQPHQFANSHSTTGNKMAAYDTSVLNGWRDPWDNELYDIALSIFQSNLQKYNVDENSCKACWSEAKVL